MRRGGRDHVVRSGLQLIRTEDPQRFAGWRNLQHQRDVKAASLKIRHAHGVYTGGQVRLPYFFKRRVFAVVIDD